MAVSELMNSFDGAWLLAKDTGRRGVLTLKALRSAIGFQLLACIASRVLPPVEIQPLEGERIEGTAIFCGGKEMGRVVRFKGMQWRMEWTLSTNWLETPVKARMGAAVMLAMAAELDRRYLGHLKSQESL